MKSKIVYRGVALLLVILVLTLINKYAGPPNYEIGINNGVKDAFLSTCRITIEGYGGKYTSTGVVLNTGYIFTAGHAIDVNMNGRIDDNERNQEVEFFGSVAGIQSATIVYYGDYRNFDLAVIEVPNPPKSNVRLVDTEFGDELFTIGMTKGDNPNISHGISSSPAGLHARCSIPVWSGNSGGGIWTKDQNIVGFVSRVSMAAVRSSIMIPTFRNDRLIYLEGVVESISPLANWCWYTSSKDIRYNMGGRLSFLYETEPDTIYVSPAYFILTIQLIGIMICAWYFRRYILG